MRRRIPPLLVLITLLLAGCGGGRVDSPPLVYLISDGGLVDGFQSSYCWDNGVRGTICVDSIEPYFAASTPIPAGTSLQIQLDSPLPDSLTLSLSREVFGETLVSEAAPVNETVQWSPAVEAGEYILAAHTKWEQGEVTYWFRILRQ